MHNSRFAFSDEYVVDSRDQWGNIDFQFKDAFYSGELFVPTVSNKLYKNHFSDLEYPSGKSYAVCLSHDVDSLSTDYTKEEVLHGIKRRISSAKKIDRVILWLKWLKANLRQYHSKDILSPWAGLERKYSFYSSFLFMGEPHNAHNWDCRYRMNSKINYLNKIVPLFEAMGELSRSGFDVGLHGSYHSALNEDELSYQAKQISTIIGEEQITTRQHFLHYEPHKTGYLHDRVGFLADSTLGFNRYVGFRNGMAHPYYPILPNGMHSKVLQIPLVIQDGALFRQDGLSLSANSAFAMCKQIIDSVRNVRGCVAILWHPHMLEAEPYFKVYENILEYIADTNGVGLSLKQAANHWKSLSANDLNIQAALCAE